MRFAMPDAMVNPFACILGQLVSVLIHEDGIGSPNVIANLMGSGIRTPSAAKKALLTGLG